MRNPLREIRTAGSVRGEALGDVRRTYTGTKLETADTDKGIPTDDIGASSTRSKVLSLAMRQLRGDWQERYGVEPFLVETLVDSSRYRGSCYRAANWVVLGETTGRGRMDRQHQRHGVAPKTVLVYPLLRDAARKLREA